MGCNSRSWRGLKGKVNVLTSAQLKAVSETSVEFFCQDKQL